MSINKYEPSSHFFVDHTNLSDPAPANLAADAFGPVNGDETNKYRTTSFIRASTTSKVFAICDGHILIQPYDGDSTKVNLIIKPTASYAPLKIKYFIYRGVNAVDLIIADLVSGYNLVQQNPGSPEFIKKIWKDTAETNDPIPTTLPASLIGFNPDNQPNEELLSYTFFSGGIDLYNLPKCCKGELIGNFTDKIGLDIILDYGDYELDYEEQLFKLDLEYARKPEHIFNVSTISGAVKQKRYKEYIHQFIDASAFFGSHIECGKIWLFNDTIPKTDVNAIYPLISKFQTKDKLYLYIQAERGRSYNFYDDYPTGQISLDLRTQSQQNLVDYNTSGWPILIKDFIQSGTNNAFFQFSFEYQLDSNIFDADLNFFSYIMFPRMKNESFKDITQLLTTTDSNGNEITQFSGQSKIHGMIGFLNNFNDQTDNLNIAVSCFFFCSLKGLQKLPLEKYYNNLWIFNTIGRGDLSNSDYQWHTIDKDFLTNLYSLVKFRNVKAQQKVYCDIGIKIDDLGNVDSKKRKLYISIIADTHEGENKSKLNDNAFTASSENDGITKDNYTSIIYNDSNYVVYKGEIKDGSIPIPTLSLIHSVDFELKQRYLQLGITEEEYNKLLYNSPTIPSTPPANPHLAVDANNIFLDLDEINVLANQGYRKFKIGLRYEDDTGAISLPLYPSQNNEVFVYTIDGFYFFSKEYAEYQEFYSELSENETHFRPAVSWLGEFGFDWIRIGDSGLSGDTDPIVNRKDIENIGHYYISPSSDIKEIDDSAINFRKEKIEFQSFLKNFINYPRQKGNESLYTVPWVSLYPSKDNLGNATPFPKTNFDGSLKCLTEATINLIISLDSPSAITQLKLKYEKLHFNINSIIPSTTTPLSDLTDNNGITYSYLQINSSSGTYPTSLEIKLECLNEFSTAKTIQVISTENGVDKLSGELNLIPNSKNNRKEVELLLVNCETDLVTPGTSVFGFEVDPPYTIRNRILSEINKTLNQALINIKSFSTTDLDLTRNNRPIFYTEYYTLPNKNYLHPHVDHYYLKSLLNQSPVVDKLIVLCINEFCANPIPDTENIDLIHGQVSDINKPDVILYKSGLYQSYTQPSVDDPNTSSHECLHALGLYHSFSNFSKFTLKKFITDNIMDYNDGSPIASYRTSTSKYQWDITEKSRIITKEQ